MKSQKNNPGFFGSFFGFQRMVSPFFITLVYFLGFAAILMATAAALYKGPKMYLAGFGLDMQSLLMQISGYGAIVIAGLLMLLAWRFVCELLIVLFGAFNRLSQIRELLQQPKNRQPTMGPQAGTNISVNMQPESPERFQTLADEKPDQLASNMPATKARLTWLLHRRRR